MFRPFSIFKRYTHQYQKYRKVSQDKTPSTNNLILDIIQKSNIGATSDWARIRQEILTTSGPRGLITAKNIDAMTIGVCSTLKKYDYALSYLDFLKSENIKPNLAVLGKLFKIFYSKNEHKTCISGTDEKQILDLYDEIRVSYPVLDSFTLDNVIQALSITKRWELCKELLNEVKITSTPGGSSYSSTIAACFCNNDEETAWKLLDEMLGNGRYPLSVIFQAYLNKMKLMQSKKDKIMHMEKLLNFLHTRNFVIDKESAEEFLQTFRKTQIFKATCKTCNNRLDNFTLSDKEFNELKGTILKNVIVGKDVFNKSTPEELQQFKQFINNKEQFDVVVDGLNVAYSTGLKSPEIISGLVKSVVSHFVNQNKKVLVLGRNHMNAWPKQNWNYVVQNSTVFLTQDLSQDDPYLLYCALNSGKDTKIISRDLMRGHKFLLGDFHLRISFDRWLMQRQYQLIRVKENGEPIFKFPSSFSNIAQKNQTNWHIPYVESRSNLSPVHWLCAKL